MLIWRKVPCHLFSHLLYHTLGGYVKVMHRFAPRVSLGVQLGRTGRTHSRPKEGSTIMVEMTVESVRINLATGQRVVILKDMKVDRYLFIWIANAEAYAIAMELQGTTAPRPLTHDLLKSVITELGGTMTNIVISDLVDDIFYARLVIDANGRHVEVDSRPSDAIALAVRAKVPIYVAESVLDRAGVTLENADEQQEQQKQEKDNLDVYRDFINSLDALDEFGKSD